MYVRKRKNKGMVKKNRQLRKAAADFAVLEKTFVEKAG